jgi:hypothetical protein
MDAGCAPHDISEAGEHRAYPDDYVDCPTGIPRVSSPNHEGTGYGRARIGLELDAFRSRTKLCEP